MSRSVAADGSATADTEPEGEPADRRSRELELFLRAHGGSLRAVARRYSASPEDAEDAFQRAVELLLTKAPPALTGRARVRWMHVVIRHEAIRLRRIQLRNVATEAIEEIASVSGPGQRRAQAFDPVEVIERRDDVASFRQAFRRLKPNERRALRLLGEGYSYREIGERTGWSRTKINRLLAEGRASMRAQLSRIDEGERCAELAGALSRFVDGEADAGERVEVADHLATCLACRVKAKSYRRIPRGAAALFPGLPATSWLSERFQTLAAWAQTRLPGRDGLGEMLIGPGASGGSGSMATLVKVAVVCAGAGGGAAVCAATGALPEAPLAALERQLRDSQATQAEAETAASAASQPLAAGPAADPGGEAETDGAGGNAKGAASDGDAAEADGKQGGDSAAKPDPTEAEFGFEAGGDSLPGAKATAPNGATSGAAAPSSSSGSNAASRQPLSGTATSPAGNATAAAPTAAASPGTRSDRMPPPGGTGEFGP